MYLERYLVFCNLENLPFMLEGGTLWPFPGNVLLASLTIANLSCTPAGVSSRMDITQYSSLPLAQGSPPQPVIPLVRE